MKFCKTRYKPATYDEINAYLKFAKRNCVIRYGEPDPSAPIGVNAYIQDNDVEFELALGYDGIKITTQHPTVFVFRKDGGEFVPRNGLLAWQTLNKYYKVPRVRFPDGIDYSASPFIWMNDAKSGVRYPDCYGYDINSSYSWGMIQDMPDTTVEPKTNCVVGDGEIGLGSNWAPLDDGPYWRGVIQPGGLADFVWPRVESPFKGFVDVWYSKKKNAKSAKDKARAKSILNHSVGYMQRDSANPILRSFIIGYANDRIVGYIDDNTLYCNTDSIVSTVRRPDIEKDIGPGLGQWKIEHTGQFALARGKVNYQWNRDLPTFRGKPKPWFDAFEEANGRPWDIMLDEAPDADSNRYYFDKDKLVIRRTENGKKKGNGSADPISKKTDRCLYQKA